MVSSQTVGRFAPGSASTLTGSYGLSRVLSARNRCPARVLGDSVVSHCSQQMFVLVLSVC